MKNSEIIEILKLLISAIETGQSGDLPAIKRRIKIATGKGAIKSEKRPAAKIDRNRISSIYQNLSGAMTREDGRRLLESEALSRNELLAISKLGKVYVTRADGVERIEEKLVEAIIGSRLSSQAIRGT